MKLFHTAFSFAIYLCVSVQGEPQCSCHNGCGKNGTTFPGSDGNIVNVAYGNPATMSSQITTYGGSGPACAAVNGRTGTKWITIGHDADTNCVHTAEDDYDGWWQVDLGRNLTVTNITVYRRQENSNDTLGALRMSGMSVYVDSHLCYSFLNHTATDMDELKKLPARIDISCPTPLTGRHVRFQKHGEDRDNGPKAYLINICEVQVWACKDGLYGAQCDQTCSGHCKDNDTCDNYYGTCARGCSTSYRGDDCRCGHCRNDASCDVTTLTCPAGCDKGWGTQFCNQRSCPAGTHGDDCGERCGQCADSDTCNAVTGLCPNGCQPGWQGDDCTQKCADGYYGQRCMSRCGNCSDGEVCDKLNGACPTGCQPGFDPSDPLCESQLSESSPNITGPLVGGVFGGLCVLALSIFVGLLIRRSRKRSSSNTAIPLQASANQSFESGAPAGLNGHVSLPEETGSAGVTEAEESHIYDGLQTPDDSDRATYSTPVFKGKPDNARNSHTYQNSALHTSDTAHDYYNI